MWLDISTLWQVKEVMLLRAIASLGQRPTLPCTHMILPFELRTRVRAADSCWDSSTKHILAAFWPASTPFKLNRKIPLNSIWAGTNLLTSSMCVSWVAFFLCWLQGGSLVIFSAKTCGSVLQFWSSSLQRVTTQLLSQYTKMKKLGEKRKRTGGEGKDTGGLSVLLSVYCSVFSHFFPTLFSILLS